jgi:ATP-dependent Clp protease protease subunit
MSELPSPPPLPPNVPPVVYAVFSDNINQATVQRIFFNFAVGMANKVTHVHLLFQSSGGFVGDGICLYNFFTSLPIDLTIYNAGTVSSMALIAYLGGKKRKTSSRAVFMMHRSFGANQFVTTARVPGPRKKSYP